MAKSDWQLMAAAAHFDNVPVRDILIGKFYKVETATPGQSNTSAQTVCMIT